MKSNDALSVVLGLLMQCFCVAVIAVPLIAGRWMVFRKAGKPGWAAIVPVYSSIVMAEVAGRQQWWGLLMLVPCLNLIILVLLSLDIARAFGKEPGFAVGLVLLAPIFGPVLGFGDAQYQGRPFHPATGF